MKAFKAYDIRGVFGEDINTLMAYRIGYFLTKILPANEILVGRDIRLSSNELFNALSNGITDAGVNVIDAGLTTTPMIYWATGKYGFDASVMITASHNPKNYNGFKISGKNVLPIGYDNGLNRLEQLVESKEKIIKTKKGKIKSLNLKNDYIFFLNNYKKDYSDLNITVDFSNGMSSLFKYDLFGQSYFSINDIADGTFPGHEPNPLEPVNQQQIKTAVIQNKSDIGIIFDGDADRVMFFDEKGRFISPDLIIAIFAPYFLKNKTLRQRVVHDIRTSKAVSEYLEKFNTEVIIWRVGRAFGARKLREVDGIYGGELAGHYYFRNFYYSDSGLLAALIMLNIMKSFKKKGTKLSDEIASISHYFNTGEINLAITHKTEAMKAVVNWFFQTGKPDKFYDFDGYRLEYNDWWFNIRPSNTEPFLRLIAEATTKTLLKEKTDIILDIIKPYLKKQ